MTRDIVDAARAWVPEMREAGADIVIALSHSGIDATGLTERMENASLYLAGVDGIDAVVTGHQHLVFPGKDYEGLEGVDAAAGTLMGKPAVMGGFWGSHMGLVDLLLERDGNGWRIASFTSEARPIFERKDREVVPVVESQEDVLEAVRADHEATLAYVRRAVGKTSAPLHSYFALVADDPSVQIVSQAQSWYVEQMMKGTEWEGLPDPLRRRAVQGRRPRRAGLLYRRSGRRHRHQERRRPVSLSEHAAGGGGHRRDRQGMAGALRRHLQPDRTRQGRPAAARRELPELQFRRDRRRDLRDRPDAAVEIRQGRRRS